MLHAGAMDVRCFSAIGLWATLAACASPQNIARLETARSDFKEKVRPAQMMIRPPDRWTSPAGQADVRAPRLDAVAPEIRKR
jgi:hypothetical protein